MLSCCKASGSLQEVAHIAGVALAALLLFLTGKFPGLKQWLPVAEEVIAEAQKEAEAPVLAGLGTRKAQ